MFIWEPLRSRVRWSFYQRRTSFFTRQPTLVDIIYEDVTLSKFSIRVCV